MGKGFAIKPTSANVLTHTFENLSSEAKKVHPLRRVEKVIKNIGFDSMGMKYEENSCWTSEAVIAKFLPGFSWSS